MKKTRNAVTQHPHGIGSDLQVADLAWSDPSADPPAQRRRRCRRRRLLRLVLCPCDPAHDEHSQDREGRPPISWLTQLLCDSSKPPSGPAPLTGHVVVKHARRSFLSRSARLRNVQQAVCRAISCLFGPVKRLFTALTVQRERRRSAVDAGTTAPLPNSAAVDRSRMGIHRKAQSLGRTPKECRCGGHQRAGNATRSW